MSSIGVFIAPMPHFSNGDSSGVFTAPIGQLLGSSETTSSYGEFRAPRPIMLGTSVTTFYSSGAFVAPRGQFVGNSVIPSVGVFNAPMPSFYNGRPNYSTGLFTAPMPEYDGEAYILPISRLYRGIIINVVNQAISTRSNFNFNSVACFKGTMLGATDSGIHVLSGKTDNGTRINAKLKTGSMDFGEGYMKYIRNFWVTHRTDGHLCVKFWVDENDTSAEKHTQIAGERMVEERVKPPRGLKGRFYTVEISNLSGADFDIDSISMLVESIKRRVR